MAILLGLGTWQVARLQWKQGLIARAAAGLGAPAAAFPPAVADGTELDFRRLRAAGTFLPQAAMLVGTRARGGAFGGDLVVPLRLADGRVLAVDLGWAAEGAQRGPAQAEGRVELEGVARALRDAPAGRFAAAPRPSEGRWYAWDLPAMRATLGLDLMPVALRLEAPLAGAAVPAGPEPVAVDFPNNHLGYAITWYGLGAALVGVYVAFGLQRGRE